MKKILILLTVIVLIITACEKNSDYVGVTESIPDKYGTLEDGEGKIVFIELGSEGCPPCQLMREVMDRIVEEYPDDVEVVFFDVWSKEEEHLIDEFGITTVPTQIFLDREGNEFKRHSGFWPYEYVKETIEGAL